MGNCRLAAVLFALSNSRVPASLKSSEGFSSQQLIPIWAICSDKYVNKSVKIFPTWMISINDQSKLSPKPKGICSVVQKILDNGYQMVEHLGSKP
jgi:hypothetical protein